jgi:hypothetical protein
VHSCRLLQCGWWQQLDASNGQQHQRQQGDGSEGAARPRQLATAAQHSRVIHTRLGGETIVLSGKFAPGLEGGLKRLAQHRGGDERALSVASHHNTPTDQLHLACYSPSEAGQEIATCASEPVSSYSSAFSQKWACSRLLHAAKCNARHLLTWRGAVALR